MPRIQVAASNGPYAPVGKRGLYLPPGWNTNWVAKLAGGAAVQPKIGVVGDSIGAGMWTSSLRTKGWAGLLRAALQASYGDGGSGFLSTGLADCVQTTTVDNFNKIICSAGISQYSGSIRYDGPGASILQTTAASGSPQTFTFQGRGDQISIWTLAQSSGLGQLTYTVDGGAAQGPFSGNGLGTNIPVKVGTTSGWGAGLHTVVVTVAAAQAIVYLVGAEFTNTTGSLLHNFSTGGYTSGNYAIPSKGTGDPALWNGGASNPVDLLIYALGVNDCHTAVVADTYIQNVQNFLHQVRDSANTNFGSTDLMIVVPHIGQFDSTTIPIYAQYTERLRGLAEAYGAGLIDFWTLGRNSYGNWLNAGYWSDGTASGVAGTNNIHPSDAGHAYMASVINPLVLATTAQV